MTDAEWSTCTVPEKILDFISTRATDRKLRLAACACCRHLWDQLDDEACRRAVEVSERYADDQATETELEESWAAAARSASALEVRMSRWDLAVASRAEARDVARKGAWAAAHAVIVDAPAAERLQQCDLLREVFGNPFAPVAVDRAWLLWQDGAVTNLARTIYSTRAFERSPELADLLVKAGCDDAELLAHLRRPEGHALGCWAIDLLLGNV